MEKELNKLSKINRVKVPPKIFNSIVYKMEANKKTYSYKWLLSAAAISLILITIDLYLLDEFANYNLDNEINYEIYSLNNGLYES
tara:strand:+ start:436 stop:690 length:255 start_codon:yes stop_codon:yes gene_type:complete